MMISKEMLVAESTKLSFRPEMLEKVWYLMKILDGINSHTFLKDRLVLKGGTALNLFFFNLPRLSIDIDLNYIGNVDRELMQADRPEIKKALKLVCEREGCQLRGDPESYAGGEFQLRYSSLSGNQGNLKIDINYVHRVPLLKTESIKSIKIGGIQTKEISVLSLEELAAGKLSALFSRRASRDLFDTHCLFNSKNLDLKKLKSTFLAYGIMSSTDLRKITIKDVGFDKDEFERKLVPVLKKDQFKNNKEMAEWAEKITEECHEALKEFIVFSEEERRFLDLFYNKQIVDLELITDDELFINNFQNHPLLAWRRNQIQVNFVRGIEKIVEDVNEDSIKL